MGKSAFITPSWLEWLIWVAADGNNMLLQLYVLGTQWINLFRPSIKSSLNRTYLISPTMAGRDTNNLGLTTLGTQSTLNPVTVGPGPACSS